MRRMQTIISTLIAAFCLCTILGADAGHPLALRLEGAVAVIAGILNGLILVAMALSLFSEQARNTSRRRWRDTRLPGRLHAWLLSLAWLAALAWAGWLWSFGIRMLWLLVRMAVIERKEGERQEEGGST